MRARTSGRSSAEGSREGQSVDYPSRGLMSRTMLTRYIPPPPLLAVLGIARPGVADDRPLSRRSSASRVRGLKPEGKRRFRIGILVTCLCDARFARRKGKKRMLDVRAREDQENGGGSESESENESERAQEAVSWCPAVTRPSYHRARVSKIVSHALLDSPRGRQGGGKGERSRNTDL